MASAYAMEKPKKTEQKTLEGKKAEEVEERFCPLLGMPCVGAKCAIFSLAWLKCNLALIEKLVKG